MGSKNNPGSFDCYKAAKPDEPMFVLLARDPLAPVLVNLWSDMRARLLSKDDAKCAQAIACADDMSIWKRENPDV